MAEQQSCGDGDANILLRDKMETIHSYTPPEWVIHVELALHTAWIRWYSHQYLLVLSRPWLVTWCQTPWLGALSYALSRHLEFCSVGCHLVGRQGKGMGGCLRLLPLLECYWHCVDIALQSYLKRLEFLFVGSLVPILTWGDDGRVVWQSTGWDDIFRFDLDATEELLCLMEQRDGASFESMADVLNCNN